MQYISLVMVWISNIDINNKILYHQDFCHMWIYTFSAVHSKNKIRKSESCDWMAYHVSCKTEIHM